MKVFARTSLFFASRMDIYIQVLKGPARCGWFPPASKAEISGLRGRGRNFQSLGPEKKKKKRLLF